MTSKRTLAHAANSFLVWRACQSSGFTYTATELAQVCDLSISTVRVILRESRFGLRVPEGDHIAPYVRISADTYLSNPSFEGSL